LEYKGEYLSEEGNRKIKLILYYINGELELQGKYLNGERNSGNVKEYYFNHQLEFEGEYLNGKRNGKGKEYNNEGKLMFEGEFLNDKRI
jgi:antitoxin component YwqK of YwqJK toxin-antitoxin module